MIVLDMVFLLLEEHSISSNKILFVTSTLSFCLSKAMFNHVPKKFLLGMMSSLAAIPAFCFLTTLSMSS